MKKVKPREISKEEFISYIAEMCNYLQEHLDMEPDEVEILSYTMFTLFKALKHARDKEEDCTLEVTFKILNEKGVEVLIVH